MTWSRNRGDEQPEWLRFFAKVERRVDGCWQWTGALVSRGYGSFRRSQSNGATTASAHRWIWEWACGPIPDHLEVDHLCFNRACVNPMHLDLVEHGENVRRGRRNQNHGKTHCLHGHAFDADNTRIDSRGRRACKTCSRERMRAYRGRKRMG